MERWKLLKTALNGKRDEGSLSSIHRHNGFKVVQKKFVLWTWKTDYIVRRDSNYDQFCNFCMDFMKAADTTEILVTITHVEGQSAKCHDIINVTAQFFF